MVWFLVRAAAAPQRFIAPALPNKTGGASGARFGRIPGATAAVGGG